MATTSKRKPTKKKLNTKQIEAQKKAKMQIYALIMFAVGVLLLGLVFVKGGSLWAILHDVIFGLFGFTAYLIPVGLIYIAILTAMDKPSLSVGAKIWQTILLIFLLSGAIQIFGWGESTALGLWGKTVELYQAGIALKGGGLASALIGLPLIMLLGRTGAQITIVILSVFILMVLTGTTLKGLYIIASKPVKSIGNAYTQKFMEQDEEHENIEKPSKQRKINQKESKFNIDVPMEEPTTKAAQTDLDNIVITNTNTSKSSKKDKKTSDDSILENMPMHPVISPKDSMDGAQSLLKAKEILLNKSLDNKTTKIIPDDISSITEKADEKAAKDSYIDDLITKITGQSDNNKKNSVIDIDIDMDDDDVQMGNAFACTTPIENKINPIEQKEQVDNEILSKVIELPISKPVPIMDEILPDEIKRDDIEKAIANVNSISDEFAIDHQVDDLTVNPIESVSMVYNFPPIDLLIPSEVVDDGNISEELKANAQRLVNTLQSFGVQTRITEICRGPAVTRYELQPSAGVKISKITGLADDIALNLATAGVRIEAPIPNKAAVGIEVPNKIVSIVGIREIIDSLEFAEAKSRLTVAMGKDIAGNITLADLAKMPHLLIAGATGSGKSVCINSIIISILFKSSPDEVKLLMVDPKVVELGIYNGIPHLLVPVVTDPRKAAGALNWAISEMLNRYKLFADNGVRDLKGYNNLCGNSQNEDLKPMPQIVIIIDELADLMMAAPNEVEDAICRLAQMARAAGMHLVIATQRPSVDVITGVIKANIPSRVAFSVSSQVDSRTILDGAGAEKLLGRGDMLFYPVGMPKPTRVQGCFVSDKEVEQVVEFIKKSQNVAEYDQCIIDEIDRQAVVEKGKGKSDNSGGGFDDGDEILPDAIACVVEMGQASTSLLQRKLKLGYARAARVIDQLEERGIVGQFEGSKPRQVLITKDQWIEMKMRMHN